jgi:hypothetical protein
MTHHLSKLYMKSFWHFHYVLPLWQCKTCPSVLKSYKCLVVDSSMKIWVRIKERVSPQLVGPIQVGTNGIS